MKTKRNYKFILVVSFFLVLTYACGNKNSNNNSGNENDSSSFEINGVVVNPDDFENLEKEFDPVYQKQIEDKYSKKLKIELQKYEQFINDKDAPKTKIQKQIIYKKIDYFELTTEFEKFLDNIKKKKNTSKKEIRHLISDIEMEIMNMNEITKFNVSKIEETNLEYIKDELQNTDSILLSYEQKFNNFKNINLK